MDSMLVAIIAGLLSGIVTYIVSVHVQKRSYEIFQEKLQLAETKAKEVDELLTQRSRLYLEELSAKCAEHSAKLEEQNDKWQAKLDSRIKESDLLRAEEVCSAYEKGRTDELRANEERMKTFSVEIRPYIKIETLSEYMGLKKRKSVIVGYQYQLLVSSIGVPAFPPHIVQERVEVHESIDKEQLKEYTDFALKTAKLAIDTYTMGTSSLIKIIEQPRIEGDTEGLEFKNKRPCEESLV